jgi:hypothetical protein
MSQAEKKIEVVKATRKQQKVWQVVLLGVLPSSDKYVHVCPIKT